MACRERRLALAALVIVIVTFDWNRARPWIDDKVSDAIGRQFVINGDLQVGWRRPASEHGWRAWVPWPRFVARNVTISNPDWARTKYFVTLDAISFEVEALPLMARRIVIPAIDLVNPSVDLERLKDGRANWTLKFKQPAQSGRWTLDLHEIAFAQGNLGYYDQQKQFDLSAVIDTLGQPIPFGAVMKQQEALAHHESAKAVGPAGQKARGPGARRFGAAGGSCIGCRSGVTRLGSGFASVGRCLACCRDDIRQRDRPGRIRHGSGIERSRHRRTGAAASAASHASAASAPAATTGVGTYTIGWTVKGTYKKGKVAGTGKIGNLLDVRARNVRFRFRPICALAIRTWRSSAR